MFKLKSSFSQPNGSEEEVLKILVLKLGQCVDHARWFCLLKKYMSGAFEHKFYPGDRKTKSTWMITVSHSQLQ